MGGAATEPPSVSLSFANNFWGRDDAGVGPMLDRMHAAKVTNDELKNFYAARAAIEEEYSRKLLNLARKPLGSCETGTLRMSADVIRGEVESMGKSHQSIAQQMRTELEEPLAAFAGGMKERRKIVQNGIEKLLKLKMQQTSTVNKARDRYEQDCLKIKGFLAQAHMVMGHEERKNKAKLEKTQINLTTTSSEYEAAVKVLEETTTRWNRDWKAACDKFQDLEEERIDYTKSNLWNFANIASTVCVSDDASCEKIRLSLEDCDVEKDIASFIKDSGTGQEIPDPPKFINFCRGDAETSSLTSEDENYSVAQFARTMNPAYRASSPAPSSFESHHDPNNPLAKEMGLQNDTKPIVQDEISVTPRKTTESTRSTQQAPAQRSSRPNSRMKQHQQDMLSDPRMNQPPREAQSDPRMIQQPQEPQVDSRMIQHPQEPQVDPRMAQHQRDTQPDPRMMQHRRDSQPDPRMIQHRRDSQSDPRMIQQREIQPDPRVIQAQRNAQRDVQHDAQRDPQPESRMTHTRRESQPDPRMVQTQRAIQPDPRLIQAQEQARQHYQQSQVPHNDYPADGMTQFCRIDAPSDRNAMPSPVRPGSRDSQSECSNATSFSSIEPPSGSASPGKPLAQPSFPEPSPIEETSMQKKRGFFNSPFARRKSKHEKEPPVITPSNRNTWGPASRKTNEENLSPTRPTGRESRGAILHNAARSASPEPVDPRANFQLNVGNNVFDVASPDKKKREEKEEPAEELDPIAQALEELKGVTKQTSLRVSADRYHGLATPQPPATPAVGANLPGGAPTPLANVNLSAAKRGTPPPSYEQPPPMSRLGAPKPAHTSRQMQKTTQMYVNQKVSMFNGNEAARSSSRSPTKQDPPRAISPIPRAVSPRPSVFTAPKVSTQNSYRGTQQQQQQQPKSPSTYQPMQRQQSQQPQQSQPAPKLQQTPQKPPQQQPQPLQPKPQVQPQPQPQVQPQVQPQKPLQIPRPQQAPKPQQPVQPAQPPPQKQPQQPSPAATYTRSASPNPYVASNASTRPRAQTTTTPAQAYGTPIGRNSYSSARGGSPSVAPMSRAASPQPPQPAFASSRPQSRAAASSRAASPQPQFRQTYDRPSSSRGSDMALQLAPAASERGEGSVHGGSVHGGSVYGGSVRGRGSARPQSAYYGGGSDIGSGSSVRAESRVRSKSLAEPKNYNSQGRLILNYSRAMYTYNAQIPEELGFQKGDILAVLRLQDDGWWEAEAVGKNGRPGLVPSNYLQAC